MRRWCLFGVWVCGAALSVLQASTGRFFLRLATDKRVPLQQLANERMAGGAVPLETCISLSSEDRYTPERGYGYDILPSPEQGSDRPYYVSVRVPDGNYRVTVMLGSRKAEGRTTVRAESRRLFLNDVRTRKGEFLTFTFVVNKRTPRIADAERVLIKERERTKLNWDDKLTLEINGERPQCAAVRIEPDSVVPEDPRWGEQWAPAEISIPDVWTHTTGSEEIVVAVVDTGVAYYHEDLIDNMYVFNEESLLKMQEPSPREALI